MAGGFLPRRVLERSPDSAIAYFVGSTRDGLIKIGRTEFFAQRFRQLVASSKNPRLVLLAWMPGGAIEEAEMHEAFADTRVGKSEQFRPSPKLLAYVRELRRINIKFSLGGDWRACGIGGLDAVDAFLGREATP